MRAAFGSGLLLTVLLGMVPLRATVECAHVFSDHMVLQRDKPIRVWGWDDPGQTVTTEMNGVSQTATTGPDGRWELALPAMKASTVPSTMTLHDKNGTVTISDILVGDVRVCSGQSNMEFRLAAAADGREALAAADQLPQIRLLKVTSPASGIPAEDIADTWTPCTSKTAANFSAVGFFFGAMVSKKMGVPVGLIEAAWGGTPIQPWTPREGFELDDKLRGDLPTLDQAGKSYRDALAAKFPEMESWVEKTKRALANHADISAPPAMPADSLVPTPAAASKGTVIFNTRIHPIIPFAIRGVIWYQGESNHGDDLYSTRFHALIRSWRELWNQGNFPFYYVQIAPLTPIYQKDELVNLWQAQASCLDLPNTGMVVTNDIGDLTTIHPRDKKDVGERLARIAFAKEYAVPGIVFSGPVYKSMQVEGGKIRLTFDHADGGLTSRDGRPLSWFEIAGANGNFVSADAVIDGTQIVVSSPQVPTPTMVRFAWANNAVPNLMNHERLPTPAFATSATGHSPSP